jgi:hypothetical protein
MQNPAVQVAPRRLVPGGQLPAQNLAEDLDLRGAVDKPRAGRRRHHRQFQRVAVQVGNVPAMQREPRGDPGGEAEQLAQSDVPFGRISPPFPDRIARPLVEPQDPVLLGRGSRRGPERLRAAVDLAGLIGGISVGVLLENNPPVLNHEQREPAMRGGIRGGGPNALRGQRASCLRNKRPRRSASDGREHRKAQTSCPRPEKKRW